MDKNLLQFVLQFRNDTDQAIRAAGGNLQKLATDTDKVTVAQSKATAQAKSLNISFGELAATAGAAFAAVGLAQGVEQAVTTIASFEQAMSTVKAVTQATATEMSAMRTIAKDLGATTRFSATDAAEGMILLGQAGFTTSEILSSITPTLNLAQAGGLGLGQAAGIAGGSLRGFNLEASESARLMDILAKAAIISNADVTTLGEGLKYAAPAATALGIEMEETIAILAALANSNITGGQGGRGFQSFTLAFVTQSKAIKKLIGDYDLAEDSITSLVKRLVEAGITTQQIVDIFSGENIDIFGVLSVSAQKGAGGLEDLREQLKAAGGTSAEVAATMDDNLNGAILNAQSAMEGFVIAIGEAGATDILIAALEKTSGFMMFLQSALDGIAASVRDANGNLTAFGLALDIATKIVSVVAATVLFGLAIKGLTFSFGFLTVAATTAWAAALNPIALVSTGLVVGGALLEAFAGHFKEVRAFADALYGSIGNIIGGIMEMLNLKDSAELEQTKVVVGETTRLVDEYAAAMSGLGKASDDTAKQVLSDFEDLRAPLEKLATDQRAQLNQLTEDRKKAAKEWADLNGSLTGSTGRESMSGRAFEQSQSDVDAQIQKLTESVAKLDAALATGSTLEWQAEVGIGFREAAKAAADLKTVQEALDAETQKALDAILLGLGERKRAAAALLAQGDLEGEQLIRQTLMRETDEALRKAGIDGEARRASILNGMLPTINAIAASEQARAEYTADKKVVDALKGQNEEYRKLEERVLRLRDEAQLTQGDVAAVLANSSYQKGATELLDQLGPAQQAEAAERQARATNASLLAQFEQYLKDGTVKFQDEAGVRSAIALKLDADLNASMQAQRDALKSLDQSVGFGAANDPLLEGSLQQDLARIQVEEDTKRALLLDKYNQGVVDYQGYKDRLAAIDAEGARRRKAAETANTVMLLSAAQQTGDSITGVLKETLGEQSALYKLSFAATKAFAIAQSIMNIQTALASTAASLPFPANLGAIATVAAETASIISTISSVALAMKDGGAVVGRGGPRDDLIPAMLSNGEFVVNAEATKRNRALLEALNGGRRYADGGYVAMSTGGAGSQYRGTGGTQISIENTFHIAAGATDTPERQRALMVEIDRQSKISARAAIREEMRANGMLASVRG